MGSEGLFHVEKPKRLSHVDSKHSDQTGQMPLPGAKIILLTLSCSSSYCFSHDLILLLFSAQTALPCSTGLIEPRHEKTCLWGFRPGKTQTGLLSYTD